MKSEFTFSLSDQDYEHLRWYWEDYLEYPLGSATEAAAKAEERLNQIGETLYRSVFQTDRARQMWNEIRPKPSQSRIEIISSDLSQASRMPWELMKDPESGSVLSTTGGAFVRKPAGAPAAPPPAPAGEGPLRVLLLACLPAGRQPYAFRSTARRLLHALAQEPKKPVVLDLLRPPSFAQLTNVLLEAEAMGQPYHVLQIDGYALLADIQADGMPQDLGEGVTEHLCTRVLAGEHGYLILNNPVAEGSLQLVDGSSLGELMRQSRVPVLVLNACRASGSPFGAGPRENTGIPPTVRAFHSLAGDAMQAGAAGVVSLPYNIDTATSAQFLLRTYSWLGQGLPLGQAASMQRKRLQTQAERQIDYGPVRLLDWPAPLIYEPEPLRLVEGVYLPPTEVSFPKKQGTDLTWVYANAPAQPPANFSGLEETLLAMDSAWHTHSVILLRGGAGMGKTTTAAEFARWCKQTGAVDGPVLYTSFEQYQPLVAVLDQLAGVFWEALERAGYRWETLSTEDRADIAFHVLNQIPVLWIWDCVERISGYPKPGEPHWSAERRRDLMTFLQEAEATPARFVLISRQDEGSWLQDLSLGIEIRPLPMRERFELARRVLEEQGHRLEEIEDWRPLLEYTQGNPMAIRCLVTQAIFENLRTRMHMVQLVARVRALELMAEATVSDGLEEPLRASLEYVLQAAFSKGERKLLALLHLFRGAVSKKLFLELGAQREDPDRLEQPEEEGVANLMEIFGPSLLDRAATLGLLTSHGNGNYFIPPALTPFLEKLFEEHYPAVEEKASLPSRPAGTARSSREEDAAVRPAAGPKEAVPESGAVHKGLAPKPGAGERAIAPPHGAKVRREYPSKRVTRAFVVAVGRFGAACFREFEGGNRDVIMELDMHEHNLMQATRLANKFGWWDSAAGAVQSLGALYEQAGRIARWKDLVDMLIPQCADTAAQTPLPGRERFWRAVFGAGARLARRRERLHTAEALQTHCVRWDREQVSPYLSAPLGELDEDRKTAIRTLAESIFRLAEILRRQGFDASALDEEAVELREKLQERQAAADWARELGRSYTEIAAVRDLVMAERWLRRSFDLLDKEDASGRASCLALLGRVAWERFNEARRANHAERDLIRHLNSARKYYQRAIEQYPPDNHCELANCHRELGDVCCALGDLDRALPYYHEAIRHAELDGSLIKAAQTRFELALSLRDANRVGLARKYAQEAVHNFKSAGDAGRDMLQRAKRLLEMIDQKMPVA